MILQYPIVACQCPESDFVAEILMLRGCLAQGETVQECLEELETGLSLWLESA